MAVIYTTKGVEILVDDELFDYLSQWNWHINMDGYAYRHFALGNGKKKYVLMHRFILGAPEGIMVDHKNHNILDNRIKNLRLCNNQENQWNQKPKEETTSQYKGVTKRKYNYEVVVDLEYMGKFTDEIAAANAYNYYARAKYGEFAYVNDVPYMNKDEWMKYKTEIHNGVSKYNGLTWRDKRNVWEVFIYHDGKQRYIGTHKNEDEAAKIYNRYIISNNLDKELNEIK